MDVSLAYVTIDEWSLVKWTFCCFRMYDCEFEYKDRINDEKHFRCCRGGVAEYVTF